MHEEVGMVPLGLGDRGHPIDELHRLLEILELELLREPGRRHDAPAWDHLEILLDLALPQRLLPTRAGNAVLLLKFAGCLHGTSPGPILARIACALSPPVVILPP